MTCEIKSIEKFCSEFKSVDMNLSGGSSAPTIEVSIIGGKTMAEYDSLDKKKLVSSIIDKLISSGIVPDSFHKYWDITKISRSDSEAGVTTQISLVDSVWRKANYLQIGLTGREFGDIQLGQEYYDVRGIFFENINKDALTNFLIEKDLYTENFNDLNFARKYLNSSGEFVDVPSNVTAEDWIDNISESIPDPRIEFGQIYYTFKDLLNSINNYSLYFFGAEGSPSSNENLISFEGMGTDVPSGLMNDTGSLFDIMNKAASRHGAIFIANGFVGLKMLKINNDFGKLSDIKADDNTVISIPEYSVSSNQSKDFSAGFNTASSLTVLSPGRYPTQKEDEIDGNNSTTQKKVWFYSSSGNPTKFIDFGNFLTNDAPLSTQALTWAMIRDLPVVHELGAARYMSETGEKVREGSDDEKMFQSAYPSVPDGHTWYTGFGLLTGDMIPYAAREIGLWWVNSYMGMNAMTALSSWFANYKRFAFTRVLKNNKYISLNGDQGFYATPIQGWPYGLYSIGFNQFGTVNYPAGSPDWSTSAGLPVSYLDNSTPLTSTSIGNAVPFGTSGDGDLNEILEVVDYWGKPRSSSIPGDYGALIVDFGENVIPQMDLNVNFSGFETFIDSTESLTDKGGLAMDGIGAANKDDLANIVEDLYYNVKATLNSVLSNAKSRSAPLISLQGYYDPNPPRVGSSSSSTLSGSNEPVTIINDKVKVRKSESYHQCGQVVQNTSDFVARSNRKLYDFNANYSFSNVVKTQSVPGSSTNYYSVPYKYLPKAGQIEEGAYYSSCSAPSVEYLEKLSFVTKNKPADIKQGLEKYIENMSISIVGDEATFSYRFSHQPLSPDYRGLMESKISLQNIIN